MRVKIGSSTHKAIIECVKRNAEFALEMVLYKIVSASRIESTDYIRVVLEEADAKCRI